MNTKYFELLLDGKIEEAEKIRRSDIPTILYKFVPLTGTAEDEKKFISLRENAIWFSDVDSFNDPYEHKGMILNEDFFQELGIAENTLNEYKKLLSVDDIEVASLSASGYENLPMWAYYANNSKGFCIEYEVLSPNVIYEVIYETKRIKVGKLIVEITNDAIAAMKGDKAARKKARSLAKILMTNMYIKDVSWKHEQEYRIVAPVIERLGENIPIKQIGLRVNRVIAGIHCNAESLERLAMISKEIGCSHLCRSVLSEDNFGIELVEYEK